VLAIRQAACRRVVWRVVRHHRDGQRSGTFRGDGLDPFGLGRVEGHTLGIGSPALLLKDGLRRRAG
jgi:hypothetical protein